MSFLVGERLAEFEQDFKERVEYMIGYPMAVDFDYSALGSLLVHHCNNVGDPFEDSTHVTSKSMEREVIDFYANMFHAPSDDRWGYVTNGGTESNLHALYLARERYPDAPVYYSNAAHYSIKKALAMLRMEGVPVATQPSDEMDYGHLDELLKARGDRAAIAVATIGTTMTEAKDNVTCMRSVLEDNGVEDYFVHSDAAFAGIPTALLDPVHPFDLGAGADSVAISGHKFIGSPIPCGILITKRSHLDAVCNKVEYIGSFDTTISGSRSGHTPLMMWLAIQRWGLGGLAARAKDCVELADYTEQYLAATGWQVRRNPKAMTVLFPTPNSPVRKKWQLSTQNGWSHVICAPGVKRERIDAFLEDMSSVWNIDRRWLIGW